MNSGPPFRPYLAPNTLQIAGVLPFLPERAVEFRMGSGKSLETVKSIDVALKTELFGDRPQCPNPPAFEDSEFSEIARHSSIADVADQFLDILDFDLEQRGVCGLAPALVRIPARRDDAARRSDARSESRRKPFSIG